MALPLTANTQGRTGRAIQRVPRRLFEPAPGVVRSDRVNGLRDHVAADLHSDGVQVWQIAAMFHVRRCAVFRMIVRHKARAIHLAD